MTNEELILKSRQPYLLKMSYDIIKDFMKAGLTIREVEFIIDSINRNLKDVVINFKKIEDDDKLGDPGIFSPGA